MERSCLLLHLFLQYHILFPFHWFFFYEGYDSYLGLFSIETYILKILLELVMHLMIQSTLLFKSSHKCPNFRLYYHLSPNLFFWNFTLSKNLFFSHFIFQKWIQSTYLTAENHQMVLHEQCHFWWYLSDYIFMQISKLKMILYFMYCFSYNPFFFNFI